MTDPTIEDKLLELANLLNTFVGAGAEDGALAVFTEAMSIISQHGDLPKWEFLFLQLLLNFQSESLFPEDCRRYKRRILELAIENVEAFTSDPNLSQIGTLLDLFLADLSAEDRDRLTPLFDAVSAAYIRPDPYDIIRTPNTDEVLPTEILEKYAILAGLYKGEYRESAPALDLAALHNDLCSLVDSVKLSMGSRHDLLGEIHYRTIQAGIRLKDLDAVITGAKGLFDQPRNRNSRSDQTEAATLMLMTLGQFEGVSAEDQHETLAKITEFIWDSLKMIFRNNILRFVAIGLDRLFPLLAGYIDYLSMAVQGSEEDAVGLIFAFQGTLTMVALDLLSQNYPENEDWPEFIIDELDSLLRAQTVGSVEEEVADLSLTAERGQHPAPLSLTGRTPPPRGYEERQFFIQTTSDETAQFTPPNVDSVRRGLASDAALVFLFASQQAVYGGWVTSGIEPTMRRLCDLERFRRRSLELTGWLHRGKERYLLEPDDFGWIHKLLIKPTLDDLPNSISRLILVAPQVRLPLHLAYDGNHFLLEDYTVTYSYSANIRRPMPTLRGASNDALIFDGSQTLHFAEIELSSIVAALETRFNVTRYARREEIMIPAANPRIVHYAGHMSSRIEDHRWSLQLEDGTVAPNEILRCVGRHTELVSLFSCYSADQIGTGPTPIGISTLLRGVGVQSIVGCMWPIPDETASRIATGLYRGCLEDRLAIAESLGLAMLRERAWSPAVWGSVICYGSPDSALLATAVRYGPERSRDEIEPA